MFPRSQLQTNIRVFIHFSTSVWCLSLSNFFLWIKIGKLFWSCFFLSCVVSHWYCPSVSVPCFLKNLWTSWKHPCPTPRMSAAESLPAFPSITAPVPVDSLPFLDLPTLGRAWVWAGPGRNQCFLMSATRKGFCHRHLEPYAQWLLNPRYRESLP